MSIHCSSCGDNLPETKSDGYTECCNKSTCCGGYNDRFGFEGTDQFVRACCWGRASMIMKQQGMEEKDGMCRF